MQSISETKDFRVFLQIYYKILITRKYDEIKTGDVFTYDGTIFLKMDIGGSVDLSDGMTVEFQPATEVKIVSARLIITENY